MTMLWMLNTVIGAVFLLLSAGVGFALGVFSRYQPHDNHRGCGCPQPTSSEVRRIVAGRLQ